MAEIRVNVTASKSQRVNVSSSNIATEITATPDTSQYYSNLAKNWAIAENIVDGKDYSSKHYAKEAQQASELANTYKEATEQAYISFSEQYTNAETELTALKDAGVQEINTAVTDGKTEITTTKDLAVDAVNNTKTTILQDIEFVADGEKKEIEDLIDSGKDEIQELTNEIKDNASDIINRVSLSMFDTILKDHVLTYEETKGLALQGTYVYKDALAGFRYGYPDFYAKVVEEYNQATTTETVNGVTVKVHSNGHKFYDIANKSAIDSSFNSLGTAWFYGVDTANERIFLPRNNYFEQMTVSTSEVGKSVQAGLPNITGTFDTQELSYTTTGETTGALYKYTSKYGLGANGASKSALAIGFDASRSNSIYGKSDTVQPNAVKKLLYICVGNTQSDTSWVDVVTQVEGGVKDLEDKKNACLDEIATLGDSYDNLTHRNITNCLLEVPQRIKYTLENGTLTIKAGSVVIVPYGTEDKTSQYPKGAKFLHENFKVYDTQFADGKFFVWAELVGDVTNSKTVTDTKKRFIWISTSTNEIEAAVDVASGTSTTGTALFYDTDNNTVDYYKSGVASGKVMAFPLGIVTSNGVNKFASINQVFNGMGYIGSTKWLDKGVKLLCCDGRNEDGTLKNVEVTTKTVRTYAGGTAKTEYFDFFDLLTGGVSRIAQSKYTLIANSLGELDAYASNYAIAYIVPENRLYWHSMNEPWTPFVGACVGSHVHSDAQGTVSEIKPKQPFRAVDYNDAVTKTTPHIKETYVNGTSWYRVWSDGWCEQGGEFINTGVVTFLIPFSTSQYTININYVESTTTSTAEVRQLAPRRTNDGFSVQTSSIAKSWRASGYIF